MEQEQRAVIVDLMNYYNMDSLYYTLQQWNMAKTALTDAIYNYNHTVMADLPKSEGPGVSFIREMSPRALQLESELKNYTSTLTGLSETLLERFRVSHFEVEKILGNMAHSKDSLIQELVRTNSPGHSTTTNKGKFTSEANQLIEIPTDHLKPAMVAKKKAVKKRTSKMEVAAIKKLKTVVNKDNSVISTNSSEPVDVK